jgi:superfamily I DNA and/or RNA helicase
MSPNSIRYNAEIISINYSERLKANLKKFSDYKSIIQRIKEITRRFGTELDVIQYYFDTIWPNRQRTSFLVKKIKKQSLEEYFELRPLLKDSHFDYLLVDGRVLAIQVVITKSNMIQIVGLGLVPNSDPQEYESEITAEIQWDSKKKVETPDLQFLRDMKPVQDHILDPIDQWQKFLIWQEQQIIKNQKIFVFNRCKLGKRDEILIEIATSKQFPPYLLKSTIGNEFSIASNKMSKDRKKWTPVDESLKLDPAGFIIKFDEYKKIRPKNENSKANMENDKNKATKNKNIQNEQRKEITKEIFVYKIVLDVDEDYLQEIKDNPKTLPENGFLISSISGDIAPLRNQMKALERFSGGKFYCPKLSSFLFNGQKAQQPEKPLPVLENTLQKLNERQKNAVKKALVSPDLFLLQGPPGTGKTTVIAELAYQVTLNGGTILIASQTNLAVDNALDRLLNVPHLRPLRIGATHRITSQGMQFLPENVTARWLNAITNECKKENMKSSLINEEEAFWSDLRTNWIKKLNNPSIDDIKQFSTIYQKLANVLGMTCNEAGKVQFWSSAFFKPFDLVVIDEVSKATLPELLMPMLLGKKIVLVGDHRQLPPLFREVTFQEAIEEGEITDEVGFKNFEGLVSTSLFVTLFEEISSKLRETLTVQYRMHPEIMNAVNNFYADSLLTCGLENPNEQRKHLLSIGGVNTHRHLIWVDSSFRNRTTPNYEKQAGTSKINFLEIDLVIEVLKQLDEELTEQGFGNKSKKKEIGVISFYGAQLLEIRSKIRSLQQAGYFKGMNIRTNTVDRFQGMEKSIIILSMVRAKTGLIGDFVKKFQRINVAMSRAQELLVIIGSEKTYSRFPIEVKDEKGLLVEKPVYKLIVDEIKKNNAFISAEIFGL